VLCKFAVLGEQVRQRSCSY